MPSDFMCAEFAPQKDRMSKDKIAIEDEPVAVNINGIVNVNGYQAEKFKWIACSDTKPLISADCTRRNVNNAWLSSLIFDENFLDKVDSCPRSYEDGPTTIMNKQERDLTFCNLMKVKWGASSRCSFGENPARGDAPHSSLVRNSNVILCRI